MGRRPASWGFHEAPSRSRKRLALRAPGAGKSPIKIWCRFTYIYESSELRTKTSQSTGNQVMDIRILQNKLIHVVERREGDHGHRALCPLPTNAWWRSHTSAPRPLLTSRRMLPSHAQLTSPRAFTASFLFLEYSPSYFYTLWSFAPHSEGLNWPNGFSGQGLSTNICFCLKNT